MRTILKWAGVIAGGLAALVVVALVGLYAGSALARAKRYPLAASSFQAASGPAAVADGAELIKVLGCTDCHGADLRGKKFDDIPMVVGLYAPNLTTRTASWSDADFERAIRHGIRPDGRSLYIMPSSTFARFSDEQTAALIAYIRSVPAGGPEQPGLEIRPLGHVAVVAGQVKPEAVTVLSSEKTMPFDAGPRFAKARTFVSVTCAECHGNDLSGAAGTGAPDLKVAAAYDLAHFKTLLRTGRSLSGRDLGMMSASAPLRYSRLSDAQIEAIHAYLTERALKAPPPKG